MTFVRLKPSGRHTGNLIKAPVTPVCMQHLRSTSCQCFAQMSRESSPCADVARGSSCCKRPPCFPAALASSHTHQAECLHHQMIHLVCICLDCRPQGLSDRPASLGPCWLSSAAAGWPPQCRQPSAFQASNLQPKPPSTMCSTIDARHWHCCVGMAKPVLTLCKRTHKAQGP